MFVTDKQNYDINAVLMADLTADQEDNVIQLSTTSINDGEVFIIGSETMYVQSVSGNNYTVVRAYQSDLSSHSESDAIYVPRTLTVERGVGGTTAATHTNGTAISVYTVPDDIEELCIAETIVALMEAEGGYYRWVGSERAQREYAGRGIEALRAEVQQRYSVRRVGAI